VSIIVGLLLFIAVVPGGLVYWWKERQAKHTQDEAASKKPAKKKPDPKKPKSVVKQVNEVNPKKPKTIVKEQDSIVFETFFHLISIIC